MLCGKWLQSLSPIWCEWLTCWAFDAQNRNFIPWSEEFRVPRTPVIAIVAADAVTHPAEQGLDNCGRMVTTLVEFQPGIHQWALDFSIWNDGRAEMSKEG
jgi:hypothetical protein